MKIQIKRFDKTLPLPSYKSPGAVCVDLYTRETATIEVGKVAYIPMNIAVKLPPNSWAMMVSRSSTHKMGVMQVNSLAVFDVDYCGDNDEYIFAAYNYTSAPVTIEKGTRLCQLMVMKYEPIEIEEVDKMDGTDRGGFGSTGIK